MKKLTDTHKVGITNTLIAIGLLALFVIEKNAYFAVFSIGFILFALICFKNKDASPNKTHRPAKGYYPPFKK